jgi:hypothetical protein
VRGQLRRSPGDLWVKAASADEGACFNGPVDDVDVGLIPSHSCFSSPIALVLGEPVAYVRCRLGEDKGQLHEVSRFHMGAQGSCGSGRVVEENGQGTGSVAGLDRRWVPGQLSCGRIGVEIAGVLGEPAERHRRNQESKWAGRCASRGLGSSSPDCQGVTCRSLGVVYLDIALSPPATNCYTLATDSDRGSYTRMVATCRATRARASSLASLPRRVSNASANGSSRLRVHTELSLSAAAMAM